MRSAWSPKTATLASASDRATTVRPASCALMAAAEHHGNTAGFVMPTASATSVVLLKVLLRVSCGDQFFLDTIDLVSARRSPAQRGRLRPRLRPCGRSRR